ncbi:MAG: ShlB/FhaC/HecB family hemolysin secretion/activation protein [Nitrosomonadales bacterium]|nr:ShlB/FhaC/HecB family hemolysin secretion/activation protein [Nitrosomonadales bacterium]
MKASNYFLRAVCLFFAGIALSVGVYAEPAPDIAPEQSSTTPPAFPKFDIQHFDVSGNSLLDPAAIERMLSPFTGKEKDFGDIQRALEALQQAYVTAGYGAVQVHLPEQDVEQGTVRFIVIEGKIKHILTKGNTFHDDANILASVPKMQVGSAPKAAAIEIGLKAANENPSKKTQVLLKTTDEPGEIDATLQVVDEKPWKVGALLDNTGSAETGLNRLGVFYQNSNVANRDHVFTAQYTTSPAKPGSVKVWGGGYRIPLYALGDSVEFFAGSSDVNSGTVQSLFTVSGSGDIMGARYNHNLARHGDYDHKLTFGMDQRAYRNNVVLVGGGGTSLVPDVTVHPLSATYAGEWHVPGQQFSYYLSEIGNLKGGDKGGAADFAASRTNASADYMITRYGAEYSRAFASDWQTHVAFNGQSTADALVAGEQFGLGGASSVRGYYEREMANDQGYRGSLELYSPDFGERIRSTLKARALVFYDFGELSRNKALAGEVTSSAINSMGVGLRASMGKHFSLQTDWAQAFAAGNRQAKNQSRVNFSAVLTY